MTLFDPSLSIWLFILIEWFRHSFVVRVTHDIFGLCCPEFQYTNS